MLAHIAVLLGLVLPVVGGPLGPLVVRLAKGRESAFVDANAVEALNFGAVVLAVMAAVTASKGRVGTYPAAAPRFVR